MKMEPIMKRNCIYFSISAGFILTLRLGPTFAGLLKFQGWAIENDDQDPTIYNACNFIVLSPDNKQVYTPHYNRKGIGGIKAFDDRVGVFVATEVLRKLAVSSSAKARPC